MNKNKLSLTELKNLLATHKVDFELIYHAKPILTAADAIGIFDFEKAAPVFIFKTEKGLITLIRKAGTEKLDLKKLKKLLGFTTLTFAGKEEILQQTGYQVGAIPLIGMCLPCYIDKKLLTLDYIYGGTGDTHYTLKINSRNLPDLCYHPQIIQIT